MSWQQMVDMCDALGCGEPAVNQVSYHIQIGPLKFRVRLCLEHADVLGDPPSVIGVERMEETH